MFGLAELLSKTFFMLGTTARDIAPIVVIIVFFQFAVLRRRITHPVRVIVGLTAVVVGLAIFLVGLESGLFPLGRTMARQLADPAFVATVPAAGEPDWTSYVGIYVFAFCLCFAATIAEPALISLAVKAGQVTGGTVNPLGLRLAVAVGAGAGATLGTMRLCAGIPLVTFMMGCYIVIIFQTLMAPRAIVPLAYDSGPASISTVTVPMVAALGLGLAEQLPGRSPLLDGFGLIASTALFPMLTVMGYAQLAEWRVRRRHRTAPPKG